MNWVREGVNLSGNAADDFQTDGTLYVYSTLRPEAPPQGSLALTIMDARWLQALVFLVVFLGGVLLIPARCRMKTLAVGVLITIVGSAGRVLPDLRDANPQRHSVLGDLPRAGALERGLGVPHAKAACRQRPPRKALQLRPAAIRASISRNTSRTSRRRHRRLPQPPNRRNRRATMDRKEERAMSKNKDCSNCKLQIAELQTERSKIIETVTQLPALDAWG